jgi:hypothetical protein
MTAENLVFKIRFFLPFDLFRSHFLIDWICVSQKNILQLPDSSDKNYLVRRLLQLCFRCNFTPSFRESKNHFKPY